MKRIPNNKGKLITITLSVFSYLRLSALCGESAILVRDIFNHHHIIELTSIFKY